MRPWAALLALIFSPALADPFDFGSYCKGYCVNRYQDGIYFHEKCFCGDYYEISFDKQLTVPKRLKKHEPETGPTYYHSDY